DPTVQVVLGDAVELHGTVTPAPGVADVAVAGVEPGQVVVHAGEVAGAVVEHLFADVPGDEVDAPPVEGGRGRLLGRLLTERGVQARGATRLHHHGVTVVVGVEHVEQPEG